MAFDPAGFPTPIHAWRYWKDAAERYLREMAEIREAYENEHGKSFSTDRNISDDIEYQTLAGDYQQAMAMAAMYADATQIRLLEAIISELRNPRGKAA